MANFPLLATGQLALTTVAQQLPSVVPAPPSILGTVRGQGVKVLLECTKASTVPAYYGGNNSVTTTNGKEVPPSVQDEIVVNDLAELFLIAASNNNCTISYVVTNIG